MLVLTITKSEICVITTPSGEVVKFKMGDGNNQRSVSLVFLNDKSTKVQREKVDQDFLDQVALSKANREQQSQDNEGGCGEQAKNTL